MAPDAPIDLEVLLRRQHGERYRAVIVLGRPAAGKSRYALALAARTGATYLDVLALYCQRPELAEGISPLSAAALLDQIRQDAEATAPDGACLVDNADFLLNTWPGSDRRSFADMVLGLPDGRCCTVLALFLQDDGAFGGLEERPQMRAAHGAPRVLRFEDLAEIR